MTEDTGGRGAGGEGESRESWSDTETERGQTCLSSHCQVASVVICFKETKRNAWILALGKSQCFSSCTVFRPQEGKKLFIFDKLDKFSFVQINMCYCNILPCIIQKCSWAPVI